MVTHFSRIMTSLALIMVAPFALAGEPDQAHADEAAQAPDGQQRVLLGEQPHQVQITVWMKEAAKAYDEGDHAGWAQATEELHKLRPYNQDFMRHLVEAHAQTGELSKAFNMMLLMQQQGLSEQWDEIDNVAPLREHRLYGHLNDLMVEAGQPFGEAEQFATIDPDMPMPEGVAFDPASERLFVGNVREGRIVFTRDGESWETFASPESVDDLMAVLALAVDSDRGHLWVATGAVGQFEGYRQQDHGRTALLKLDLESGELLATHRVIPDRQPRLMGSLALAGDGTVYAADSHSPTVFRLRPDDERPRPFFTHPNLSSLRGLAVSDDDRLLYAADYEVGIFVIGLENEGEAWKLATPETLNEAGIDGLMVWDNHLVGIQNGITPQRVIRMQLGDDGLGAVDIAPIASAQPEFDTPTFGAMNGSELYFLAGSHWHHVDSRGRGDVPPIAVLKTDVDSAEVRVVGEEVLEQMQQQREQQQRQQ